MESKYKWKGFLLLWYHSFPCRLHVPGINKPLSKLLFLQILYHRSPWTLKMTQRLIPTTTHTTSPWAGSQVHWKEKIKYRTIIYSRCVVYLWWHNATKNIVNVDWMCASCILKVLIYIFIDVALQDYKDNQL